MTNTWPVSIHTGHTCLPFAKAWIPWHHKPWTVLLVLAVDLWIAFPKIPQHVRLDPPPLLPADDQQWQEMSQREKSGLYPTWCNMDATKFSRSDVALLGDLYLSSDRVRDMIFRRAWFFFFSSSVQASHVSHPFVRTSSKHQGCLKWLAIRADQQRPSFLSGHVQLTYRVQTWVKARGRLINKNFPSEAVSYCHSLTTLVLSPSSFCSFHRSYPGRMCLRLMLNCCVVGLRSGKHGSAQIFWVCQSWLTLL